MPGCQRALSFYDDPVRPYAIAELRSRENRLHGLEGLEILHRAMQVRAHRGHAQLVVLEHQFTAGLTRRPAQEFEQRLVFDIERRGERGRPVPERLRPRPRRRS